MLTMIRILEIVALLTVAVSMASAWAHLLELPAKMRLPRDDYLTVQQIYRGWALLGIVVVAALASTAALAVLTSGEGRRFHYATGAAACVAASLALFFCFAYPANKATANWTHTPEGWKRLRARWEYSHAASAVLYFAALVLLLLSVL